MQKCLRENLKNGESISAAKATEILKKIENKNSFETTKTLALERNLPSEIHERVKPQQDDSVRIELTLSKEQFAELEQVKSLLSHICPGGSFSEIIATLAKKFNQTKLIGRCLTQPALAWEEVQAKPKETLPKAPDKKSVKAYRQYISVKTKRMLLMKAQNCCEYQDPKSNQRCKSKYKLEIDHRHPVVFGGSNEIKNLRILCQTHNALAARMLGIQQNFG